MPSLAASVEKAVGVDDDDPGELLAVYEYIYAGETASRETERGGERRRGGAGDRQRSVRGEDKENVAEMPKLRAGSPPRPRRRTPRASPPSLFPSAPEGENTVFHPPHVGRLKMHADALHFEADMFGLDLTSLKLMRWQIRARTPRPRGTP